VKGLIGALGGAPEAVRSPTYTLLQEYEELDRTVVHVDLYRTSAASEQRTIGLEDYFGKGIVLVEWADRWELGWPERSVTLRFRHVDPSVREIELLDVAPDDISLDSSVNKSGEQVENYDTGP
jgi:tRNA threonylcarbamoyl adenosine modification protein YjeE